MVVETSLRKVSARLLNYRIAVADRDVFRAYRDITTKMILIWKAKTNPGDSRRVSKPTSHHAAKITRTQHPDFRTDKNMKKTLDYPQDSQEDIGHKSMKMERTRRKGKDG